MGKDIFNYIKLLKAPSHLTLNVSRNGTGILLTGFFMLLAISELLKEMQFSLDLNQEIIKDLGTGKFDLTVTNRLMTYLGGGSLLTSL